MMGPQIVELLHEQVGDESDFWEQATINFAELIHDAAKVLHLHDSVDSPQMSNIIMLAGRLWRRTGLPLRGLRPLLRPHPRQHRGHA